MRFILDSSVIVPLFNQEEETVNAELLFDLFNEYIIPFAISPLVLHEVGNCIILISKKAKLDGMEYMKRFLEMDLKVIEVDNDLLLSAYDIAKEYDLTFYDAVHVAVSRKEKSVLITLDKDLLDAIDESLDIMGAIDFIEESLELNEANNLEEPL